MRRVCPAVFVLALAARLLNGWVAERAGLYGDDSRAGDRCTKGNPHGR
jgi:hypothetical protein